MGNITALKKWDLEKNAWRTAGSLEDKRRALSIATYGTIRHDESDVINYIIFMDGCRVENHTREVEHISDRKAGIANVISYFEKKKENYKIELLMVDNDAPLREESRLLAGYVDLLSRIMSVRTINVIGFSKCGVVAYDMMKYLQSDFSLYKTRVYSVSSPYMGTVMASPLFFERTISEVINSKISCRSLADKIIRVLMAKYYSIMSNSHMDLDIAIKGGVPDFLKERYDSEFLDCIFSSQNITAVSKVAHYQNICTKIGEDTLKNSIKTGDIAGLGLCIINSCLFDGESDGMVLLSSQKKIEDYYDDMPSSVVIEAPHNLQSNRLYSDKLLSIVDENMNKRRKA